MTTEADVFSAKDYRSVLVDELTRRKAKRPGYSLRAFSRDIGIQPARLSAVLRGRHGISGDTARSIAEKLRLNGIETAYFVDLVESKHARVKTEREEAKRRLKLHQNRATAEKLERDKAEVMTKWYYAATLQLISIYGNEISKKQIAERLAIQEQDVDEALMCLQRTGLLQKTPDGWSRNQKQIILESPVPSALIRKFHAQVLEQISDSILREEIKTRKNLSSVISFASSQIDEAREWLERAQQAFMAKFGNSEDCDRIYAVGFHLAPIDRKVES